MLGIAVAQVLLANVPGPLCSSKENPAFKNRVAALSDPRVRPGPGFDPSNVCPWGACLSDAQLPSKQPGLPTKYLFKRDFGDYRKTIRLSPSRI